MAKIVLTISADNKATQSVKLLNAEVQTLSKTLSSIKVNKNLTAQINALSKYYTNLAKAAVKVNEATTKRQLTEQKLVTEVKRGRTEDERTLKVRAQRVTAETRLEQTQKKTTQATQQQTSATKQGTKANEEHRQSILSMTRGILEWQIATTLVMKPLRMLQNALQSINDTLVSTEDRVIELQRVVGDVANASELYDLAQKYGQTFDNVSEATLNFARRGMSWNESLKATEAALLAINVAELDVGQATDGLSAIMAQFGIEASNLTTVVDMLNKTADNFPVTTEKILTALQRTGSTASTANLSLEETIGLITTLSKATNRSGENIGTALNSILNISQKDSTLKTFAKLGDDVAQVIDRYQHNGGSLLEVLESVSAKVKDLDGDILSEEEWDEANGALKEAMGEDFEMLSEIYGTAGTYRRNYFIALLNDLDTVKQVESEIADAQGYSQEENQKYLETYTAKLNTLKAQWEDIANSEQGLLGLKKVFVDIGSALLTVSKWTGGLRTTLIGVGSALATLFAPQILKGLGKIGDFFKNLSNPLKNFKIATQAATKAQQAQTLATNLQAQADKAAAVANQVRNTASASGAAIESAETTAIRAQTVATQAQARADELAATAAKAKGAAFQTVLGIIGIGVTVISSVAGAIKQYNQEQEENRKQTIENYRTIEDTYKELQKLNEQYKELADNVNRTDEQERDFNDIENKLVEVLKDKYNVLSLLTEGTDEYREAVKRLADEEEKEYERNLIEATAAAEKGLANTRIGKKRGEYGYLNEYWNGNQTDVKLVREILSSAGLSSDSKGRYLDLHNDNIYGGNVTDQLYNYAQYAQAIDALQNAYNEAIKQGDYKKAETITNSDAWKNFKEAVDSTTQLVNDYFDTKVALLTSQYETQFGKVTTQEQFNALETWVQNQINAGEYYNDTIRNVLAGLIEFKEEVKETEDIFSNDITKVTKKYEDLIKKLEELRDANKEVLDLEEKKKDYLEAQDELLEKQNELIKAQQALEKAKNEATVRRFNQATGQWEWQVDEKKVSNTEDDVIKAEEAVAKQEESIEKARAELEKQAYNTIIDLLDTNKPPTNDELNTLLGGLEEFLGDDFIKEIKGAILGTTNVDLDKPIRTSSSTEKQSYGGGGSGNPLLNYKPSPYITQISAYDSGGIANGLGFMAKATALPETVNDPELTAKILSPVSSAEFDRYTKAMGVMFEQAHNWAQVPQFERVNNSSTDNRVDNSGQINFAGGLSVGSEQRDNFLNLLSLGKIVPN